MKRIFATTILALVAFSAFAFPGMDPVYFPAEMKAIRADLGTKTLGELTVADLVPVAERLDVARQKDQYLMVSAGMSMFWPGAGQFFAGDWAGGSFQTGLHLGLTVGTLVWAHSLLPADVRWGNLDYMASSKDLVDARWSAHSFQDYLPSLGALAAGGAVDFVLRAWSAKDARATARARIDAGKVSFEPRFDAGRWGFGMQF